MNINNFKNSMFNQKSTFLRKYFELSFYPIFKMLLLKQKEYRRVTRKRLRKWKKKLSPTIEEFEYIQAGEKKRKIHDNKYMAADRGTKGEYDGFLNERKRDTSNNKSNKSKVV